MKTPAPPLNIVIFGVGAMGCLFGSYLSPLAPVTLFGDWVEQIETIRRTGLNIAHIDGSHSHHALQATDNLDDVPAADIVLLLVKSYQTDEAVEQIATILKPDGLAITLQNGLGNFEKLAQTVGQERAGLGVTTQGATVLGAGRLRHAGDGPTHLAAGPEQIDKITQLAALFNRAGLETHVVEQVDSLVWGKLAINTGINPLTALLEVPNGLLVDYEALRQVMSAAANETVAVAAAMNIQLPFDDATQRTIEVCRATAGNYSSMLQDVQRDAPTEIEAICGAVVRWGQKTGVSTPVNEVLLQLVKAKEAGKLSLNPQMIDLESFELSAMQDYIQLN